MPVVRRVLAFVLVLALAVPVAAHAQGPAWNARDGIGAKGYDVVAYVTENRAVRGDPAHVVAHDGLAWRFASAANAARFRAEPARYVPRYGGFCAYGVAAGYKVDVDPEAFSVVDGRLYLNYNKSVRADWLKDTGGQIARAERNWPGLVDKPRKD